MERPAKKKLPIDPLLPRIASELRNHRSLIVQASPGSGKTTRIPPFLLDSGLLQSQQEIFVLVPRRLAAKMAALRVAEERGEAAGETVGYQFRFENVSSSKTRLKFLTEGMLLRFLASDPLLSRAGLVILDEFHERHLHSDVALSYLRRLQQGVRPDLRLIVMSATLQTEGLTRFLPEAAALTLEAPQYPVEVQYIPSEGRKYLEVRVREALAYARSQGPDGLRAGDALVFLPGMSEIRRCAEELEKSFGRENIILPLHGELPREQQAKVFEKADRPKVILATNVAETSLTIEGITIVIDSGLHRQASYSWWSGIPALKTRPISKASAIQRAGRAGRTGPGICYRLYAKGEWESRLAFETPEIRRSDLTATLLEIKAMGVDRATEFPWFEAPSAGALQASADLLFQLGALEAPDLDAALTSRGKRMAEIPVHPRLARLLLEAESRSCLGEAAKLAALIAEDALDGLDVFHQLETGRTSENVRRLEKVLLGYFPKAKAVTAAREADLAYALLTGFPDRVAKRRSDSISAEKQRQMERGREVELVFSNGGAGTVQAEANLEGDFFVVLEVQEKQFQGQARPKVHVTSLAAIHPEWLFDWQGSLLQEKEELLWEERSGKIVQLSQILYGQLVLSEQRGEPRDAEAAERAFFREGLGLSLEGADAEKLDVPRLLAILSKHLDTAALEEILSRIHLLKQVHEVSGMPRLEGRDFADFLLKAFSGIRSRRQVEEGALSQGLVNALPPGESSRLATLLPRQVTLLAGRKVQVHYSWGKDPWIESRLQDFFGMSQGPSLAGGRLPLLLHLLGPNRRAVQVTQDLGSFWKNAYPQVRQELKRRYPRHAWPENPTTSP